MWIPLGSPPSTEVTAMPELLDSELEAAMRSLLFWLAVPLFVMGILCIVEPAYAFEIPILGIKILEPTDLIINEASPVIVEPTLAIQTAYPNATIIDQATRIVGINKVRGWNITIMFEGKELGIIQEGSKFENVPIHKSCLSDSSQYGSDEWYACEVNR